MLMIARNKLEVLPPELRRRVQLVEADMRRFAVDRSNVFDPRVQNLAAGTWSMPANRCREFVHPRSGNRVTIKEEFTYDLERQMVVGAFVFDEINTATGKIVETIRSPLTLRYVFRYEMEHLLTLAGFRIDALFGDFKTWTVSCRWRADLGGEPALNGQSSSGPAN